MTTQPVVGSVAADLYAELAPLAVEDADRGWALLTIGEAIGRMVQDVDDLARDREAGIGWSAIVDRLRVPAAGLAWLGQMTGVRVTAGAGADVQRAEIANAAGFRRGSPAAMIGAARAHLTGAQTVVLRERDGGAYRLTVITYADQTPDPAAVERALIAQKPAGVVLLYLTQTGQDYATLAGAYADYAAVAATYADYHAVTDDVPTP